MQTKERRDTGGKRKSRRDSRNFCAQDRYFRILVKSHWESRIQSLRVSLHVLTNVFMREKGHSGHPDVKLEPALPLFRRSALTTQKKKMGLLLGVSVKAY